MRDLHAHGGGEAVSHGAEAARGHPVLGLLELEELRRPHLVLADFGGDEDVLAAARQLVEPLDGILRLDDLAVLGIGEAVARAPPLDLLPPQRQRLALGLPALGLEAGDDRLERGGGVADDRHVDPHVLVERGGVDIDVDLLRIRREGVEAPGDAVVEARADGDHEVAVMHGEVGLVGAVHADHAEELPVGSRQGAESHQGQGRGEPGQMHELGVELAGAVARIDDAAAAIEERPLCRGDEPHRFADARRIGFELRAVALMADGLGPAIGAAGEQHVLGQVDHDRSRPSRPGDIERLVQNARQVIDVLHQIVVLGARARDAGGVRLLEGVVADEVGRHLPGEADHRDRIHQRVGQPGDRVGGARPAGHQHDADLAGRAGIAFGGVDGGLLMPHQDVAQMILLVERVVDRQYGAAGIAENDINALVAQRLDDHLRPNHLLRRHDTSPRPKTSRGTKGLRRGGPVLPAARLEPLVPRESRHRNHLGLYGQ